MDLSYRKLNDVEIAAALADVPDWGLVDGNLSRLFKFDAYKDGLVFASAVGYVADHLNHHPDIHIGYQTVRISMHTHDASGLTAYDFELARRIDRLA